jgi:mono/diheme cytochrome c family protein
MTPVQLILIGAGFVLATFRATADGVPDESRPLPAAASHSIQFEREIKPIFEASCVQCHGRGKAGGKFSLENRDTALRGGVSGPSIVPGDSAGSYLIELVAGVDPDNVMPQKGTRLTPAQVGVLRAWIDQGALWDDNIGFGRAPAANLMPRRPDLPPAPLGITHPVDRLLWPYFAAQRIDRPGLVDDRVFARRAYLDVIGLLPTPLELDLFVSDANRDKRTGLVRRLLGEHRLYAEHWLTFWNDALRNDYRGTGYIDGGRQQITGWLFGALAANLPFDRFVRELVDPVPGAEGFTKGITWRGVVNASQTPEMQAAQNLSQVFMGVNLKCASCHDSFINDWTLADAYGLAGVYAEHSLEMVLCDKPTGEVAPLKFIYPQLGVIDPTLPREARLKRLAELMTSRDNARLTRTIVNRLWAKFMGRGLVEPLDDMEQVSWHVDLLDWFAADLAEHDYDLKRTIELMLTSEVYQWPAVSLPEDAAGHYTFRGPLIRRLSAEQYLDAVSSLTGTWHLFPSARADFDITPDGRNRNHLPVEPVWIWTALEARDGAAPQTVYWRRTVHWPMAPSEAALVIACDNRFKLFVNEREIATGSDFRQPKLLDLKPHIRVGTNILAIETVNDPARPDEPSARQESPAGLIVYAFVRHRGTREGIEWEKNMDVATDDRWLWSETVDDGWTKLDYRGEDWRRAVELGPAGTAPWQIGDTWQVAESSARLYGRVRAALVPSDPLLTALGRPNREQVVTSRPTAATTLQALELTNGETLANWLRRGAERLVADLPDAGPRDIVIESYRRGLGRAPTPEELRLAEVWLGTTVHLSGVEDFLWAMTMLPEFQLIR